MLISFTRWCQLDLQVVTLIWIYILSAWSFLVPHFCHNWYCQIFEMFVRLVIVNHISLSYFDYSDYYLVWIFLSPIYYSFIFLLLGNGLSKSFEDSYVLLFALFLLIIWRHLKYNLCSTLSHKFWLVFSFSYLNLLVKKILNAVIKFFLISTKIFSFNGQFLFLCLEVTELCFKMMSFISKSQSNRNWFLCVMWPWK